MKNQFNVPVRAEWIEGEQHKMMLLNTVTFTDSKGEVWTSPVGSIIDGASIPKFFWRIIGSPFIGHYRRASVIHDVQCVVRTRPYKKVHKMFYEAMLADGVPKRKAKAMYYAVRFRGPKW